MKGNSTSNGVNCEIYQSTGGDSQNFFISENSDWSYIIKTKITNNQSAVEVANYGKGSGDNVQQWSLTGHESQSWIFEPVADPHLKLHSRNIKNNKEKTIIKTQVYKEKNYVHTVVFVK